MSQPANVVTSITVRMYNTGSVGDCLLLLFYKGKDLSYRMLIDCGGYNTIAASVKPCVEDIRQVTGGVLDLLVVTHQHEDHLSGFNLARDVFDKIEVRETWMSWVEDKTDEIAKIVKKKYGKKLKELTDQTRESLQFIGKLSSGAHERKAKRRLGAIQSNLNTAMSILEFEAGNSHGSRLGPGKKTNDDAMEYVRSKGKKIVYRKPGEVIHDQKGAEGIQFFVLGPPRDKDLAFLKIETDEDEMYHLAAAKKKNTSKEPLSKSGVSLHKGVSPFESLYHLSGNDLKVFQKKYNSTAYKWRQIESDSADNSSEMALAMTRLTNNTSLAMALAFADSGKVLLLPADAQSGNWLSWHTDEVSNQLKQKGGKTTDELLASTVFYKTGHHLSHNGTASHSGLEKMTHPALVAFAPLVQDKVPSAWGGAKNFPAKKLYGELISKTKGRIVRTDEGLVKDPRAVSMRALLPVADEQEFMKCFKTGSCYKEYTVKG